MIFSETSRLLPLNVGLARHDADWNWQDVHSPFARLYFVVEGEARVVMPSGTYNLTPGHLYFIPPFTHHSDICDGRFTHYYIHIYEEQSGSELSMLEQLNIPVEVEAGSYGRSSDGTSV